MSLELPVNLEAEIRERAASEGIPEAQFLDRLLRAASGLNDTAVSPAVHSIDPANDASIALLNSWLAEAPTDPEAIREAEEDLAEFMHNINAERKRAGARPVYPEAE